MHSKSLKHSVLGFLGDWWSQLKEEPIRKKTPSISKEEYLLYKGLIRLKKDILKGNYPDEMGLCIVFPQHRLLMKSIWIHWYWYSKDEDFPIKITNKPYMDYTYASKDDFWNINHPYGAMRFNLIEFMIESLEKRF